MTSSQSHSQMNKDPEHRPTTPETLPGTVSSCSLEDIVASNLAIKDDRKEHKAAVPVSPNTRTNTSSSAPSSVCQQRKLSAAIVTTPEARHDFVAGRPTVTVEDLNTISANQNASNSNVDSSNSAPNSKTSDLVFETPPPMSKPSKLYHRGTSTCGAPRRNHREGVGGSSNSSLHKNLSRQTSTPSYPTYGALLNDPHPLRVDAWAEAPATHYNIRGPNYLRDRKKEPSEEALFSLLTVDIVQTKDNQPILQGLCNDPNERIQRALRREEETGVKELPEFIWAINLAVPGPPFYHVVIYLGCDDMEALKDTDTPMGKLTKPFFFGASDEVRDNTFKLIPRIVEGNFVVKKAVGTKPSLIGRKLKQHYIRNSRFMELIVDISSDKIANSVVGLSMGYARQLVTDMMFVLEGDTIETLPERILGGVRFKNLDFKKRDGKRVVQKYA